MRLDRSRRQLFALVLLLGAALLVAGALVSGNVLDATAQAVVYDRLLEANPQPAGARVTIVALDDSTIARYGRWPLPRRAYADLLDSLVPLRPTVVAFDVGLYDASDRPEDDARLAASLARAGNVVLGAQGQGYGTASDTGMSFPGALTPAAVFARSASLAAVNVDPDVDSLVRTVPLSVSAGEQRLWSIALVTAARQLRADLDRVRVERDAVILPTPLGERRIPVERGAHMNVYFGAGPVSLLDTRSAPSCADAAQICVVSLADVVAGNVPAALLRGRIVLVGAHSAGGLPDDYPVPTSGSSKMYGVEIWAHAALTILSARYLVFHEETLPTLAWVLLVVGLGMACVLRWRLLGFVAAHGLLLAYMGVASLVFTLQARGPGLLHVPSIAYVGVPAPVFWVLLLGYLLVEEQRAVSRIQHAFGLAVTPEVARHILTLEESGGLRLGGEVRRASVLFGDIRGFTAMSEEMKPTDVLATLNRYFEGMVTVVQRHGGTVNKYNGDNLMVIWGAPLTAGDHARNAVACALELQELVRTQRAQGGPAVGFGIGVNTGELVAGFLGAQGRFEYTVIGDTVNVAARLTGVAERDTVVVSAETLAELGPDARAVDLGAVQVKGRHEAIHAYRVEALEPTALA